jgi:hypothetical protein
MLFKRFLDLAINLDIDGDLFSSLKCFGRAVEWNLITFSRPHRSAQDQARLDVSTFGSILCESVVEI